MLKEHPAWTDRTGGCLCGAVRYRVSGIPFFLSACHCTDCHVRSGGAFSLSLPVRAADFSVIAGTPIELEGRIEDRVKTSRLCAACHTRLWLTNTGTPGVVIVKAGTLDKTDDLHPVVHLWLSSRQPWVAIPDGVQRCEQQAVDLAAAIEAFQRQLAASLS